MRPRRTVLVGIICLLSLGAASGAAFTMKTIAIVRRQLFFWVDDNYFSLSTTTTF